MKLIAHRGACLEKQENTLEALLRGSECGADFVECDPRFTKDGIPVLFHDGNLQRLAGNASRPEELTLSEMREILGERGLTVTTVDDLLRKYPASGAPILFDLSFHAETEDFFRTVYRAPFSSVIGIHSPDEGEVVGRVYPKERMLAFMPGPGERNLFAPYCGILRLWENWVPGTVTVAEVKREYPDRQVWIMAKEDVPHPLFCMNGSPEGIRRAEEWGADGMLLNDIRMAVACRDAENQR